MASKHAAIALSQLPSPILLKGDARTAYRDPAACYVDGVFYMFFTLVQTESDGQVFMYTATSQSSDLLTWTPVKKITARDQSLNFSSPGNVVWHDGRWVLCLQTYPRMSGAKYGSSDARIWIMTSPDLLEWSEPVLLRVKGPQVEVAEMGRMIDPYLIEDKDFKGKYWCFYKQNGVSMSYSYDLVTWTYCGHHDAGENVSVVVKDKQYVMFHSPDNGIGVKVSQDLIEWKDQSQLITLGQNNWDWARGRITAGYVLDGTGIPHVQAYLLFYHGTGPEDERTVFDTHASIGIAWSTDLLNWRWPGKEGTAGDAI